MLFFGPPEDLKSNHKEAANRVDKMLVVLVFVVVIKVVSKVALARFET